MAKLRTKSAPTHRSKQRTRATEPKASRMEIMLASVVAIGTLVQAGLMAGQTALLSRQTALSERVTSLETARAQPRFGVEVTPTGYMQAPPELVTITAAEGVNTITSVYSEPGAMLLRQGPKGVDICTVRLQNYFLPFEAKLRLSPEGRAFRNLDRTKGKDGSTIYITTFPSVADVRFVDLLGKERTAYFDYFGGLLRPMTAKQVRELQADELQVVLGYPQTGRLRMQWKIGPSTKAKCNEILDALGDP